MKFTCSVSNLSLSASPPETKPICLDIPVSVPHSSIEWTQEAYKMVLADVSTDEIVFKSIF